MYVKNATAFNEAIKRSANEGKVVLSLLNNEKHEAFKFRSKDGQLQAKIQSGAWISVDKVVVEEREEQEVEQAQEEIVQEYQKKLDMRSFKKWLKENDNKKVGYVGSLTQIHPLLQFAGECNVSIASILNSKWGYKYKKLCENYNGIPGRIDGHEARCLLAEVVGYHRAFS